MCEEQKKSGLIKQLPILQGDPIHHRRKAKRNANHRRSYIFDHSQSQNSRYHSRNFAK
jgi:hypothetical protein